MSIFLGDEYTDKGPLWSEEEVLLPIIKDIVESVLGGKHYHHDNMATWVETIGEKCLRELANLQRPFKYIMEVSIMQKNGAGLHYASSCLWDTSQDGTAYLQWENETMYCIISIFGLGL